MTALPAGASLLEILGADIPSGHDEPETAIGAILGLAKRLLGLSTVLVTWTDGETWRAEHVEDDAFGLMPGATLRLAETFCALVAADEPIVIDDVRVDPRGEGFPTPTALGVRTFVGVPLALRGGRRYGTLCALDRRPSAVGKDAVAVLRILARLVAHELDHGRAMAEGDGAGKVRERGAGGSGEEVIEPGEADRRADSLRNEMGGPSVPLVVPAGDVSPPGFEARPREGSLVEPVPTGRNGTGGGDEDHEDVAVVVAPEGGARGRLGEAAEPAPNAVERRVVARAAEMARLYGALVEQLPAIVYVQRADAMSTTLYVSPQGERLHGWTAEECIADPDHWRKLIHAEDRERVAGAKAAADANGGPFDAEYRLRTREGRYVWFRDRAELVADAAGTPRFWQGLMFDVTATKAAEERFREAEARYRSLVENLPAITYVDAVGPGGEYESRYVSPQVERILGWTVEEARADLDLWRRLLHPEDRERILAEDARTEATGEPFDVEYRLIARDGRVVWLRDVAVPVAAEHEGEGVLLWRGLQFDVSAPKEAERRLAAAERRERIRLSALLRAASALNEAGTLEALLPALAWAAAEAVGADRASVYAYDEARRRTIAAAYFDARCPGQPPEIPDRLREMGGLAPEEIPAEAEVLRRGAPLRRNRRTPFPDPNPSEDWQSDVVVPLLAAGASQGVLYVREANRERAFGEDDLALLQAIGNQAGLAILRVRDAAAAERRAEHLALVNQVGQALATTLDLGDLCAIIHREVGRVLVAEAFFVALDEGDGRVLFPYSADGGDVVRDRRLRLEDGPTRSVLGTGRPYVKREEEDGLANSGLPFGDPSRRSRSALYVPMRRGERVIGVLSAQRYDTTPYDEEDLRTLETIAQQAAASFDHATLFAAVGEERERAERRADHLALLNRIGTAVSQSLEVETLCEALQAEIGKVLAVDAGYVALYDEGARQIWVPYKDDEGQRLPGNWLPLGDGPTSRAIETRAPVVIAPGKGDDGPRGMTFGNERRSAAALHVPMTRDGRVVGVLSVQRYDPTPFEADDLRTLETIARVGANALAHAHLYAATKEGRDVAARHAADLKAVLTINRSIASATDLSTVLAVLARELGGLVPYDAIALYQVADSGRRLRPVFAWTEGQEIDGAEWELADGEGIVGHAFGTGLAEVVNDAQLDPRSVYPRDGEELRERGHHVAVAPLVVAGERVGVLYLSRRGGRPFTADEFALFRIVAEQAAVAVRNADLLSRNRELYRGGVEALASAVDAKDASTRGHSERVARLAGAVARRLGIGLGEVEAIEVAGLLHDIGKIGVPDAILQKPASLDDVERAIMVGHAALGADILAAGSADALRSVVPLVRHHHEWVNGGGYPDGLAGEAIPLGATIIAAADAYDTMVTDRPYRSRRSAAAAIKELRHRAGQQFRRDVVEALAEIAGVAVEGSEERTGSDDEAAAEGTASGQIGDTRALGLLVELAQITRHIPDLSGFLQQIGEIVRRRLGYERVRLMLGDPESGDLVSETDSGEGGETDCRSRHERYEDLLTALAGNGQPRNLSRFRPEAIEGLSPTEGSALVVPLIVDGRLIGVIEAAAARPAAFTAADEAVLTAVAGQVAASVHVAQLHDVTKRAAATDGLTGLANHRAFYEALRETAATGEPFSVMLMDVEGLKWVNDSAGHLAGDELLRRVAATVQAAVRPRDVVARYGGDEFGAVMIGITAAEANRIGEEIRRRLRAAGGSGATIRYGVATMPGDGRRARDLVEAADRRLYEMRTRGERRGSPGGGAADATKGVEPKQR